VGEHILEEVMMTIIDELAQELSTNGSKVDTKMEERTKSCGFGYLEGINVTIDIPPTMHDEEDIRDPKLSLPRTEEVGAINCILEDTRIDIPTLAFSKHNRRYGL